MPKFTDRAEARYLVDEGMGEIVAAWKKGKGGPARGLAGRQNVSRGAAASVPENDSCGFTFQLAFDTSRQELLSLFKLTKLRRAEPLGCVTDIEPEQPHS